MIKTMKISALVAGVLLVSGIFFKSQHWIGANIIFIIGTAAGVLSAAALVSSLIKKPSTGMEQFNIIFSSLVIAIGLLGFVFKVMHWPGAAKLVWATDLGLIISAALFLIDGFREKDHVKSALKIMTMFFILFLVMLIVMIS